MFGFRPPKQSSEDVDDLKDKLASLEVKEKYLVAIQQASLAIVADLDFESVTQKIVDLVVKTFDYSAIVLFLIPEGEEYIYSHTVSDMFLVNSVVKTFGKAFREHKADMRTDNSFVVRTARENKAFEGSTLPEFVSPTLPASLANVTQNVLQIKRVISLPLNIDNKPRGVIMFCSKRDHFEEEEKNMLKVFVDEISIALYNTLLYQKTKTQVIELEVKNHDLSSLFNLTSNISQSLDPDTVAQAAANSIPQEGYLLGGIITHFNKDSNEIIVAAVSENDLSRSVKGLIGDFSQYTVKLEDPQYANNMTLQTFQTGEVHYTDKLEDLLSPPVPRAFVGPIEKILDAHSAVSFPLRTRGEVTGTVAYIIKGRTYTELQENEKQLLNTYTLQISIALENANLFRNLETTLSQLKEARRRERDMLDVMGHELRTPISIARNALAMLERTYEKGNGVIDQTFLHKYLDMATESVRREVSLIETLLSATKVDASRLQLMLNKVDLKDVVNDGIEGQHVLIEQKGLKLNYTPPAADHFAYADRIRTQEIMDNFLSNAAKYTEKGEITISVWQDKEFGWIQIRDTGMGISPEDLQNLGKKFFRAKQYIQNQNKTSEFIRPGGTGLGLYVAFDLIRVMGGKLFINSEVGKGSAFTFSLPIYTNQPDKSIDETFAGDTTAAASAHITLNGTAPQPPL